MEMQRKITKPYKIVYVVSDTVFGGGTHYFSSIVSGLDKTKYSFGVACRSNNALENYFRDQGIQIYPFPVNSRFDIIGMIRFAQELSKENIDCVLLGDGSAWNSSFFLKFISRIPHIWSIVHMTHIGLEIREFGFFERLLSMLYDYTWSLWCDTIIVSNQKNAQILKSEGISREKIHIIENGIDFQSFIIKRYTGQAALKKQYKIEEGKKVVGMLARLGPGKDFDTLFDAIKLVLDTFPECVLMLVGTGPFKAQLEQKAAYLGIGNRIIFTGWVEDAYEYIDLFDIFVFSSIAEGIPYSILEAMVLGKPIVSTDNGAIGEAIFYGKTGILVPPKNARALADGLLLFLQYPEKAHLMGKGARDLIKEKFDLPIMLQKFNKLFMERLHNETR